MHTIEYTKLLPGIPRLYLSLGQTGLENKYLDDPPPSSPVSSRKTKACVRVTGRRNWLSTEFGHETV